MKNKMIYKIGWILLLLPLFAGCNDTDDVAAIFTGKTWKLNYITVDGGHDMFNFWENETKREQSIAELKKAGSYNLVFTTSLIEGEIVKGKIEGNLVNGSSLSGTWSANGKNNKFQGTVTATATSTDPLAKNFMEGLNNATSYEGDSNNLFLLYKSQSGSQTFRMAFYKAK